jgi:hypothetical protein
VENLLLADKKQVSAVENPVEKLWIAPKSCGKEDRTNPARFVHGAFPQATPLFSSFSPAYQQVFPQLLMPHIIT